MDNNENGKWITVKGRHVFIKDGQSVADAIDEFETYKKAKENPEDIDAMTENSYDFESLNKIYGDKDESDESGEEKEIETISEEEYNNLPDDYKGTIKELVDTAEFRGENKEDVKNQYENLGYDSENDKMVLTSDEKGTVLKPVKVVSGDPMEEIAEQRVHDKEQTLYNDKVVLDYMNKEGMSEINGMSKEDLEKQIADKEKYIETARSQSTPKQEIWKDPEVQKQVAIDVARSFGAKEVKVNGETINLEDTSSKNEKFSTDYWKSRSVDMYDSAPDGWSKLEGATTAPKGYAWYSNNKSRFSDEYRHALVKEDETNNGREKYY